MSMRTIPNGAIGELGAHRNDQKSLEKGVYIPRSKLSRDNREKVKKSPFRLKET